MPKLACGWGVGDELLYRMLHLFRGLPNFLRGGKLSWTHYRTLAPCRTKEAIWEIELAAREFSH
jgi:hypothetical protein